MIDPDKIYTPDAIASALACGTGTIRKHIREGTLAAIDLSQKHSKRKTYRIKGSDALKWFSGQYTQLENTD